MQRRENRKLDDENLLVTRKILTIIENLYETDP
jgi:hypothetical protein